MTTPPTPDPFVTGYVTLSTPPGAAPDAQASSVARKRWPLFAAGFAAGAVVATAVALTIGLTTASPPATLAASAQSSSSSSAVGQPTKTSAASPPAEAKMGERVTNGGITLTVNAAAEIPSVTARPGFEQFVQQLPGEGAKFFAVSVRILNDSAASVDVTCGATRSALLDDTGRKYDVIKDLAYMQFGPMCGDKLQPGFEADMTYVYRVPTTATIAPGPSPTQPTRPLTTGRRPFVKIG